MLLKTCWSKKKVSETELYEILADYLMSPTFQKHYGGDTLRAKYDGWAECQAGEDIETLWKLIPKVPEIVSHVILANLPEQAGLNSEIPQEVLEQLTPTQLQALLYRQDVELRKFRKQIFGNPAKRLDDVRSAAISHNFDLTYREFSNILQKSENEKLPILRDLALMAGDLSLVFYQALYDSYGIRIKVGKMQKLRK